MDMPKEGEEAEVDSPSTPPSQNAKKKEKAKKDPKSDISIESVAAELDVGIDVEGKFIETNEELSNLDSFQDITNEKLNELITKFYSKNKKKLVARLTKRTISVTFADESTQDIEIPHAEIPKIWAPFANGRMVLAVAREMPNSKFRIYLIQLEKNKRETFLKKLQLSYSEKLVQGSDKELSTDDKTEEDQKKAEDKKAVDETDKGASETPSENLLDFDFKSESNGTQEMSFEDLLADTPAPEPTKPSSSTQALTDLFSANGSSNNNTSSAAGWAQFDSTPAPSLIQPAPLGFSVTPQPLAPPPSVAPRRTVSPQPPTPSSPMLSTGGLMVSGGQQSQPAPAFGGFPSANLFAQPQPTPAFSTNGQSLFPNTNTTATNPFAARSASPFSSTFEQQPWVQPSGQSSDHCFLSNGKTNHVSTNPFINHSLGNGFQANDLGDAFKDLRTQPSNPAFQPTTVNPTLQPTSASNVENPFDVPEPQASKIEQPEKKHAFSDLLTTYNFSPNNAQHASPKEMFAARERKEKGPPLNALGNKNFEDDVTKNLF